MPTLLYIMGRRFCGSTVLSALLDKSDAIQNVGELIEGSKESNRVYCGCGATIQACPFLCAVRETFEQRTGQSWDAAAKLLKQQSDPRRFVPTLLASPRAEGVRKLRRINEAVVASIAETSNAPYVLDPSKECARGLFLARFLPQTKIIHLVRNPEGLAASQLWRMRGGHGFSTMGREFRALNMRFPFIGLSAINWTLEYMLGEVVRLLAPDRVLRMRYEDLCADPRRELERIERFIGSDLQEVIRAVEARAELPVGHSFAGNPMRLKKTFVFRPELRKPSLPTRYQALTRLFSWPMMARHGYPVVTSQGAAQE